MSRKLALLFLPPLAYLLMHLVYWSCKKRFHIDGEVKTPTIFVFWHRKLLMLPFFYLKVYAKHTIHMMISDHFDGELIARIIGKFGVAALRGSSRKGARKALASALKILKTGESVGITPDGPRGPRYSVADGAAVLSQKLDIPVVVLGYRASRSWVLGSWDGFVIPKPFATLDFYYSEQIMLDNLDLESAKAKIRSVLMRYEP